MANPVTSGAASFLVSRDDIVNAALRKLKYLADGQSPGTNDITNCAFSLNLILKSFNMEGYLSHAYQTVSFVMTAGKPSYTIAETGGDVTAFRPVRIAFAWRRDSSTPPNDVPVYILSREEYSALTPKTNPGLTNSIYYDPQITGGSMTTGPGGIIYPWPVVTDATNSLFISMQRPIQDILSAGQNFDLTQEWFLPLVWILADDMSEEYEVDAATIQRIQSRAMYWRGKVADFAQEDATFMPRPDPTWGGNMGRFNA